MMRPRATVHPPRSTGLLLGLAAAYGIYNVLCRKQHRLSGTVPVSIKPPAVAHSISIHVDAASPPAAQLAPVTASAGTELNCKVPPVCYAANQVWRRPSCQLG